MTRTSNFLDFTTASTPTATATTPTSNLRLAGMLPYALLILVFVFAGLSGHDPWKADEAYIFGVIQHMLETADWTVPTLAGEPFMEKPPMYYWVATALAYAFSGWLPLHDAARLASAVFMLVTCGALASAARIWWGAGMGRYVVFALVACFGTLVQSHMMMPDLPLLTGFALSAWGFALVSTRTLAAGVLLGLGAGIGFMAKGLIAPACMGATALLLPALFENWRTRAYARTLAIAFVVSLPWLLVWPLRLYLRSPALFMEWFWMNNFGRFFGFSVDTLGAKHVPWFWTRTLPWFTFPGLPLALWLLWQKRRTALTDPAIQYATVAFGVLMMVLAYSSSGRAVYAWPLLLPVALLAGPAAQALPRFIERGWAALSLLLFAVLAGGVWAAWLIMMSNDAVPAWPWLLRVLPADFTPAFDAFNATVAMLATLGAGVLLHAVWHKPARALTTWVLGMTLVWTLLSTLWMPWLDYAKSYRSVFAAMPKYAETNCIASVGLGEGERAMLRYVTGVNPLRREILPDAPCNTLLIQHEVSQGEAVVDTSVWQEVWRGSRPGETNERFWLYRTVEKADPAELAQASGKTPPPQVAAPRA